MKILLILALIAPVIALGEPLRVYVDRHPSQMTQAEIAGLEALKTNLNASGTAWEVRLLTPKVSKESTPVPIFVGIGPFTVGIPVGGL